MSPSEMPARVSKGVIGTLCLRRRAIACRAANPVALGKSSRLVSSVTFNAPSAMAALVYQMLASRRSGSSND